MADERARAKRTLPEILAAKTTGEKMVYMSVPDYTSAQRAEMGWARATCPRLGWRSGWRF
ncbi:MAG: hypothetical protein ACPGVX_07305 [Thalassobaculaceae bacterium]